MAALKLESASPDSVEAVYRDFTRLVTSLGTGVPNYAPKT